MKVSNCCGVQGEQMLQDWEVVYDSIQAELCPKCGEHCEYIEEEKTSELPGVDNSQVKLSTPQIVNFLKL